MFSTPWDQRFDHLEFQYTSLTHSLEFWVVRWACDGASQLCISWIDCDQRMTDAWISCRYYTSNPEKKTKNPCTVDPFTKGTINFESSCPNFSVRHWGFNEMNQTSQTNESYSWYIILNWRSSTCSSRLEAYEDMPRQIAWTTGQQRKSLGILEIDVLNVKLLVKIY